MKIRNFLPSDATHLPHIYHLAVHITGLKSYNKAQVEVWSPEPVSATQFTERISDGRSVFVAANENDHPVAFIELEENGHIDCFYCHPDFTRSGIGTALYTQLESKAFASGLPRLFVEASEGARCFFLKKGFTVIKRNDLCLKGIAIHNYIMEKDLR